MGYKILLSHKATAHRKQTLYVCLCLCVRLEVYFGCETQDKINGNEEEEVSYFEPVDMIALSSHGQENSYIEKCDAMIRGKHSQ